MMDLKTNELYNMDCFVGLQNMEDDSVDHVITSPPYNRKRNDKYNNYNDDIDDYLDFMRKSIDEAMRVAEGYVFFNIQKNYYNKTDVFNLIGEYSEYLVDIIIWNKTNPMPASGHNITNAYEYVLVLSKNEPTLKSNTTYTKNTVTTSVYSNNPYKKIHRAVMHPDVCYWLIDNFTKEDDLILDIFSGVGTTAYCSLERNRRYIGFEINREYWEVSKKRLKEKDMRITLFQSEE